MSWLESRILQYIFTDGTEDIVVEAPANEARPRAPKGFKFKEIAPYKLNLMTKIQYEQNGRVAYKIDVGTGKHIYRSASREAYEHKAGNMGAEQFKKEKAQGADIKDLSQSQYTKSYAEKVKKSEKSKLDMHNRNLKKILKGGK